MLETLVMVLRKSFLLSVPVFVAASFSAAATGAVPPAKPSVPQKTVPPRATPPKAPAKPAELHRGCSPTETGFLMAPMEVALKCDQNWEKCESDIPLVAKNCTGEFQSVYRLEMYEKGRRSLELEFDPAPIVPNGAHWKEAIPWTTPGELEAVVFFRAPGTNGQQSVRASIVIANKALAHAKAACDKCSGTWARYGVNHTWGCNCKTTDAGKVCNDGNDCQGLCLFRRYDGEAREEGVCSETQRMSGCHSIVMKGQSELKPRIPPPKKLPTCLD